MNSPAWHLRLYIGIISGLFFLGCVSVGLPNSEAVPAENVNFTAPAYPFVSDNMPGIQYAWQSKETANIISVITNCSKGADPAIEVLETEAKSAFDNYLVQESKDLTYNDRKAIRSLVKGDVDGVPVMMDLLVFKKDGCRYTLGYSGKSVQFAKERSFFDRFIEGYKTR